jgi:hypothetical protein
MQIGVHPKTPSPLKERVRVRQAGPGITLSHIAPSSGGIEANSISGWTIFIFARTLNTEKRLFNLNRF